MESSSEDSTACDRWPVSPLWPLNRGCGCLGGYGSSHRETWLMCARNTLIDKWTPGWREGGCAHPSFGFGMLIIQTVSSSTWMYIHYIYPQLCFILYHVRSGKGARLFYFHGSHGGAWGRGPEHWTSWRHDVPLSEASSGSGGTFGASTLSNLQHNLQYNLAPGFPVFVDSQPQNTSTRSRVVAAVISDSAG